MNKKLRKLLEANGLRTDANEQEAWEMYSDNAENCGESDEVAQPKPGKRTYTEDEPADAAAARAMVDEASRRNAVQYLIDIAGICDLDGGAFARSLLDNSQIDVGRALNMILTELQKRKMPIGSGAHVGRDAIQEGLLYKGVVVEYVQQNWIFSAPVPSYAGKPQKP